VVAVVVVNVVAAVEVRVVSVVVVVKVVAVEVVTFGNLEVKSSSSVMSSPEPS
jgi:hypothetical protein